MSASPRAGGLTLPTGTRLIGCPGATRLLFTEGASLLSAKDADHVALTGLILDGGTRPLAGRGLVHFAGGRGIKIEHCEMVGSGGDGIALERIEGEVTRNTIVGVAGAAIFSLDACGLVISGNSIRDAGNNGIVVWRSQAGDVLPGGLQRFFTPGAGTTRYALLREGDPAVLFTADLLLRPEGEQLGLVPDEFLYDPAETRRSVRRLRGLDLDLLCIGHRLPVTDNPTRAIRELPDRVE